MATEWSLILHLVIIKRHLGIREVGVDPLRLLFVVVSVFLYELYVKHGPPIYGRFFWRQAARKRAREEAEDPTGWGRLPWEPSARDRESNAFLDSLYGAWREEHWEWVPYVNDKGEEDMKEQLKDPEERSWYEMRQRMIADYDIAREWQQTRIHKRDYEARKAQIKEMGLGNVRLTHQFTGNFLRYE